MEESSSKEECDHENFARSPECLSSRSGPAEALTPARKAALELQLDSKHSAQGTPPFACSLHLVEKCERLPIHTTGDSNCLPSVLRRDMNLVPTPYHFTRLHEQNAYL